MRRYHRATAIRPAKVRTPAKTRDISIEEYLALLGRPVQEPTTSAEYRQQVNPKRLEKWFQKTVDRMLDKTRLMHVHYPDSRQLSGTPGFNDVFAKDPDD